MAKRPKAVYYKNRVYAYYEKKLEKNMDTAINEVLNYAVKLISSPNFDGTRPSRPGEAPRMVTGNLIRSLKVEVKVTKKGVVGILTSDSPYAMRLEYGFFGVDSLGRFYQQAPRPFLRRSITDNRKLILNTLSKK